MADKKSTLLYLEKNSAELFRFTRQLIAAPSPNPPGEEVAVADLVVKRMKDLGLGVLAYLSDTDSNQGELR